MGAPSVVVLLGMVAAMQSPAAVDSISRFAELADDTALAALVAQSGDEAREAVRLLLIGAARSPSEAADALRRAERVARAFATGWNDSLLLRQVSAQRRRSREDRRRWVAADSLRREGNAAVLRDGVQSAMPHWRESLALFTDLTDSSGMAAALGNLGSGFYYADVLDSASVYLERARRLAMQSGDWRTAGNAVVTLGAVLEARGELRRAQDRFAQAIEIHRRTGNTRGIAAAHNNLGVIAEALGDFVGAGAAYDSALGINRRHHNESAAAGNLINLGNLASYEAQYDRAVARYLEALAIHRELDERLLAADALYNLGLLAVRRGDYPGAIAHLQEALTAYMASGSGDAVVATRRMLATTYAATGDLQRALEVLREAEASQGESPDPEVHAGLALARADLALRFDRTDEAQREYRRALQLFSEAGSAWGRAEALQGEAVLAMMREDYSPAHDALAVALRTQETEGDARSAAWTRVFLASAKEGLGDTTGARRSLEEAIGVFRRLDDPVSEATALGVLGDLEVASGDARSAEMHYRAGLERLGERPSPETRWQLHAGLGGALERRGALTDAAREYRAAISEIERTSGRLRLEERRAAYRAVKWEVYSALAMLEHRRGRDRTAFEVSESIRARQTLDMLERGRVDVAVGRSRELIQREQDLRRRIAELTDALTGDATGPAQLRGPDVALTGGAHVREALLQAQDEYAQLMLEMRERDPNYASIVSAQPERVADIMARLGPEEALLEYLVGESTTLLFVVTRDTLASIDLNVSRRALARLIDFVRGTVVKTAATEATARWRAPLTRLHAMLIDPAEATGLLSGKRRLLIAPHAELHYLPFDALIGDGQSDNYLISRYEIAYVPSASVWLSLEERPTKRRLERVLALAPQTKTLPGSRQEIEAIAQLFGSDARVLVDAQATEQALRESAASYDVVHVASNGVLNRHNPLFSFVELSPGRDLDDRLEVHEVFGLDLDGGLVVLSACQTGLASGMTGDVPAGDEWVGFVRGFLQAGASNVLATLWAVEDEATGRIMAEFYRELAKGAEPAGALAQAKRTMLQDAAGANPFFWAGFALVTGGDQ